MFNVSVVTVPISSHRVHNGTLGTRCLLEKLGAARSKDETLTPLRVSLIFSPARTTTGGRRESVTGEEQDSHSQRLIDLIHITDPRKGTLLTYFAERVCIELTSIT